jgi:hypothetical protein
MSVKPLLYTAFALFVFTACQKEIGSTNNTNGQPQTPPAPGGWTEHFIAKGGHYSDKNPYKAISVSEMKFTVKFDNSAIYQTVDTNNQRDINKLYGFSDNNQEHHTNSARIGWRWYNNELQLYAYIYNNTIESDKFITAVPLNQELSCSIKTDGNLYIFTVDSKQVTMPRYSTTSQAVGYQLYPYFGGDEVAPHDITIRIKDL